MSEAIWQEIIEVLRRPKFDEREFFLDWLAESLDFIEISETIVACRDAKDDKFLELAVNGNAELIVSGAEDL
ncbi:putative toxin-antitoxin system toxin component, PIN family [Cylindrospermopsis raciborskii]|uniref:putative toxin-antitoxin system toxin component, PIN family n=1 Tax=Cylindrospermopsis raciborskii TaxID=77022 RepID=UPI000C1BBABB|nr:putative toxin-antitoxin system toxin component, PIN family [Cylindrospermopsis raciborskii]MCZ2206541.1 putative toxin-antitoxin system toxin component, PIN family [Cylindrospermopsis raciborskii PAMP2011]